MALALLFFKIDNGINNVLALKNDIDNQEYGYITFNQLISLMKINYEIIKYIHFF